MQNPEFMVSRTRKPRVAFGKWPSDTRQILFQHWEKNNAALESILKKKRATVQVPIPKLKQLLKRASKTSGVSIKLVRHDNVHKRALGLASLYADGHIDITIHPVMRYFDQRYVQDTIEHELDHCRYYLKSMYRKAQKPVFEGPKWIEAKK